MYIPSRLRRSHRHLKDKLIASALPIILGILLLGFILTFGIFTWYARDLPSPGKLAQDTGYSTVFYDRDGKILYEMYKDKNRLPVAFADISDYLKKATVAIEDKNFYKHKGISETGIIRAFINTLLKQRLEGGSTITQQLIKNVLLDSRRNISRKIKEVILAFEVERRYTKDQILEMYLNEAPYGGIYWGVGSASMAYFGKQPKDLNLVESAILAGLPQNPPRYSPFIGEKDAWKGRTQDVLRRMREDGYISSSQEKEALAKLDKVKFTSPKTTINSPHFVFYIKDQLEKEYGSKFLEQGAKIKTTLSTNVQSTVEKIVKEEIEKIKDYHATNGAVVVLDSKTGQILAMVGSYDYNDEKFGKFNAALGLRQPGSAIKPIAYALAFEKGYTPATVLMDVKTTFPKQGESDYIPENYDGKFRGPLQLRFALGNSINVPAVKLLAMIGLRDFMQKASDMGLTTLAPTQDNLNRFGLSIVLGGGETTLVDLTSAFSIFANGGLRNEVIVITEVDDFNGKKVYKQTQAKEKRVLSPEVAFLISHILSDNNARIDVFGPNSYLRVPGKTVAVKTGTTNDKRDNWAVGYTKDITVGVWVGNNDNSPMNPQIASGATGASPIWYRVMNELLKNYNDGIMDKPDKVKAVQIDPFLGGLPIDGSQTRTEYFIEGTEPKDLSPFYKKIKISKANGKLANDIEIKSGNYEEKEFIVITESDPISTDGKNRWQEAIDEWVKGQGDSRFHPPTETSDASQDQVVVSIKSPSDKQQLDTHDVTIRAKIGSLYPLKSVKIYLNNNELPYNETKSDVEYTINIPNEGSYELRITAVNEKDNNGGSSIKFGIDKPWDYTNPTTPTPTPSLSPT